MAKKKVTPNGVKVRRTWGALKPVTRVKQSKKVYDRKDDPVQRARYLRNDVLL